MRAARERAGRESGFIIVAALLVMTVLLLMIGAAALAAMYSRETAVNQANAIRAQMAADTGLREAIYEYNSMGVSATAGLSGQTGTLNSLCYVGDASGAETPQAAGTTSGTVNWCPPVTVTLPNSVSFTYVISPPDQTIGAYSQSCFLFWCGDYVYPFSDTRTIVSTGQAGAETRVAEETIGESGSFDDNQCIVGWFIVFLYGPCTDPYQVTHVSLSDYYAVNASSYKQCSINASSFNVASGSDPTSKC